VKSKTYTLNRSYLYAGIIVATAALLAALNLPYGIAVDPDGHRIVERAMQFPEEGYQRSRTWGFPLYDLIVYPVIYYLGVFYAKLYSSVFYILASVALFATLKELTARPFYSFLGALCFMLLPVSIVNASAVMETSQGIFFAILGLYFYVRFHARHRNIDFYLMALSLGLATSTRPDYVLLSAAVALAVLKFDRTRFGILAVGSAVWLVAAFLPFLIYGRDMYFGSSVVRSDGLSQQILRAILGAVALFGIPASAIILFWMLKQRSRWGTLARSLISDNILFLTLVALLLYSARYITLPAELEYIYVLVPLLILSATRLNVGVRGLAVLLVALAIPNVFQVHFFDKSRTGEIAVSPGMSPGAIVQDRSGRLRLDYKNYELPEVLDTVARSYGFERYSSVPSTESDILVIIPEEELSYYQPHRRHGVFHEAFSEQTVVVYPLSYNYGWRHFLAHDGWNKVEPEDFREVEVAPQHQPLVP
jgi:hypothetical protein